MPKIDDTHSAIQTHHHRDALTDPGGRNNSISDLKDFEERRERQRGAYIHCEEDINGEDIRRIAILG